MNSPLKVLKQHSLQPFNTLNIPAVAAYFTELTHSDQIPDAIAFSNTKLLPHVVIAGGSNVVFSQNINALVMQVNTKGISVVLSGDDIYLTAQAGENWHQLVLHCLQNNYFGLENLILIPGSIGAAPIQNIGAYGVELQQVFHSLKGWDIENSCWRTLTNSECEFSYRDSIFKNTLKDKFIIAEVTLRLSTTASIQSNYSSLNAELHAREIINPSAKDIAQCVMDIRRQKLPDPATSPNAGSFFKNPIVSEQEFQRLLNSFPDLIYYPLNNQQYKLAAGWLVEKSGWKGRRQGDVGVNEKQSLVLINYNGASGDTLLKLAQNISDDVFNLFSIRLVIEPRVY